MADQEQVELRQSYTYTVKKLSVVQRLKRKKGGDVLARKASKKIKTIAGRLVRELDRKLTSSGLEKWGSDLSLFKQVLAQKRADTNKIYSLHEPHVKCFNKGKEHKKYEFGSKVSILVTQKTGVIVGALNFTENLHDSKTLSSALEQHIRLTGKEAQEVYADRGYPGPKQINNTQIHIPKPDKNITITRRNKHKRRAAIEPVIGHLKHDYRMARNFLKGSYGDAINVMMAAAGMNFKRMMNLWQSGQNILAQFIFALILDFCIHNKDNPKTQNLIITF
jgi:IS5 family transposase